MILQATYNVNLLAELMKQGPLMTFMGLAVWYFYSRQQKLEAAQQAANEKVEAYLKDDRDKLTQLIINNTTTMQNSNELIAENTAIMRELQQHLNNTKP